METMLNWIVKDEGGDRYIETNREILFCAPSQEAEDLEQEEDPRTLNEVEVTTEEIDQQDL